MSIPGSLCQFGYSFEKKRDTLTAVVVFDGSSPAVPTLQQWNPSTAAGPGSYSAAPTVSVNGAPTGYRGVAGIANVSSGTGDYLITLQGTGQRLLDVRFRQVGGSHASPLTPLSMSVIADNIAASGSVEVQFSQGAAATAANPASQTVIFTIELDESSA